MIDTARPTSHGPITVTLHWLVAILFVTAFAFGQIMEELPHGDAKLTVLGWHLLAGAAILALVLPRLLARAATGGLRHDQGPLWEQRAAKFVHFGLYGLMVGLPLTGFLAVTTGRNAIPLRGEFKLEPLFTSKMLHGAMEETHEFLVSVLIAAVAAHVLGVIWHKFIRRDDVAGRMWPFGRHKR
jgi:cytochrome b561